MSRITQWTGRFAFLVAVVAVIVVVLAGPGYRMEWWDLPTALFTMFRIATIAGLAAAVIGFLVTVVAMIRRLPGALWGILALVVGMAAAFVPLSMRSQASKVPAIHDITTDPDDPPQFVAIAPLRAEAPNPVDYDRSPCSDQDAADATYGCVYQQQRDAYPDIGTIRVRENPAQVLDQAEQVARAMGWEVVAVDGAAGRLEATDTTRWFGFKDDVVVRVTTARGVTEIDVRSKSRVGRSDLGVNAERIRDFRHRLLAGLTEG